MAGASPRTPPGKQSRASTLAGLTLASAPIPAQASSRTSAQASIPIPVSVKVWAQTPAPSPANAPTQAPTWTPAPALHRLLHHPQLNQNSDLLFIVL